jgi:hypothetical protein
MISALRCRPPAPSLCRALLLVAVLVPAAAFMAGAPRGARADVGPRMPATPVTDQATEARATAARNDAVAAALRWLADHQSKDGGWSPAAFPEAGKAAGRVGDTANRNGFKDEPDAGNAVGLTGLALTAFMVNGYTHERGPDTPADGAGGTESETTKRYRRVIELGLRHLVGAQSAEYNCFGPMTDYSFVYDHPAATMAVCLAYGKTKAPYLKAPAQAAVDFIALAQNQDPDREEGGWHGWRYGIKPGDSDMSVTGWMAFALIAARDAGLKVPQHCFDGALRVTDDMTLERDGVPVTGYNFPGSAAPRMRSRMEFKSNPTMSANGLVIRMATGAKKEDDLITKQVGLLTDGLPKATPREVVDFYYWYVGARATAAAAGKKPLETWHTAAATALITLQRRDDTPDEAADGALHACHGSWDTDTTWGNINGRVYTTAINAMTLALLTAGPTEEAIPEGTEADAAAGDDGADDEPPGDPVYVKGTTQYELFQSALKRNRIRRSDPAYEATSVEAAAKEMSKGTRRKLLRYFRALRDVRDGDERDAINDIIAVLDAD